ncbi:MAG: LptF/LptG family permease [Sphingobacteriales bacterium]|nr:LptF/LptG family permease [Sphingobacteriales bacterium]
MIKKLDKLILKSFLGPFVVTFFIAYFVLMMQSLWKYIDDLVGKGLDFATIGLFLWYVSASLLTLAMPIAILISSIMTFGNLGESFELVAIKSSGISLLRFMRPLIVVAILLSGVTFLFANYVIPYANLKFVTLYNDIYYKKPAFDLKEGVFFTHIPRYAIKVQKKDPDGKTIHNVLIYEQDNTLQDNCIVAEKGVMKISDDKRFLEFNLENGYRYQERGNSLDTATEFIRLGFSSFKKLFDLSSLQKQNTNDSIYRTNYKMLSVKQLNHSIDSIKRIDDSLSKKLNLEIVSYMHHFNIPDSIRKKVPVMSKAPLKLDRLIPDSLRLNVYNDAISIASNLRFSFQNTGTEIDTHLYDIRYHNIEWHRKFSLSMACLVLFFIGAPLGSIIRKGGLGMPLVVAIIFFLIFHLLNMFGEKFVKEGLASPLIGMWLAVIVLIPVGIFLTYKAMHDSQLFSKEFYYRSFNKIRLLLSTFNKPKSTNVPD